VGQLADIQAPLGPRSSQADRQADQICASTPPIARVLKGGVPVGASAIILALGFGAQGTWAAQSRDPAASQSKVISVHDSSELHLIKAVGETLIEEGTVSGNLPGSVRTQVNINAAAGRAASSFTFHFKDGSLTGHANGKATSGSGGWESFSGTMKLEHGTGSYAHASGLGKMYGALNRRNDQLKVQAIGQIHY
jgi:hypothetical protein